MTWREWLMGATALGCAIVGGVYFAFSGVVMQALAAQGESGAAAMRDINEAILRSSFMPLFFFTTVTCLVLAVLGAWTLQTWSGRALLAGGLCYLIGMFACTVAFNVPLNDSLAANTIGWADYVRQWTLWNSIRMLASLGTSALLAWAVLA